MEVAIYVRTNVNYDALATADQFHQQGDPQRPLLCIERLRNSDFYSIWDKFFRRSFIWYRKQIREVAEESLARTKLPIFRQNIDELLQWHPGEDIIVIPIDDDDWLSPDIADVAGHFDNELNVLCWRSTYFDTTLGPKLKISGEEKLIIRGEDLLPHSKDNAACYLKTNNHALRRSFVLDLPKPLRCFQCHATAWRFAVQERSVGEKLPSDVANMMLTPSVIHRHVGCLSVLGPAFERGTLPTLFDGFRTNLRNEPEIEPGFEWAADHIARVMKINERLCVRLY